MWKCTHCAEQLEEQFEVCWKCGNLRYEKKEDNLTNESVSTPVEEKVDELPERKLTTEQLLSEILYKQLQQEEMLNNIQGKVGCLFAYMVFGLIITFFAILISMSR